MPKDASAKSKKRDDDKPARGTRTKKNPNAPKRALSAYMFFSQDWRERIKAENPDAGFGEVGKLLGAKWKELSDEEKKPYVEQAQRDKTRAEEEKAAYDGGHEEEKPRSKKSRAKASSAEEDDEDDDE